MFGLEPGATFGVMGGLALATMVAGVAACDTGTDQGCGYIQQCVRYCGGPVETSSCFTVPCPSPLFPSSDCECSVVPSSGDACTRNGVKCNGYDKTCGNVSTTCTCSNGVFVCDPGPGCYEWDGGSDASSQSDAIDDGHAGGDG